jgi:hypothetical protein
VGGGIGFHALSLQGNVGGRVAMMSCCALQYFDGGMRVPQITG